MYRLLCQDFVVQFPVNAKYIDFSRSPRQTLGVYFVNIFDRIYTTLSKVAMLLRCNGTVCTNIYVSQPLYLHICTPGPTLCAT
jgi:hypothetical protein